MDIKNLLKTNKSILVKVFIGFILVIIFATGYIYRNDARSAIREYIIGQETISKIEETSKIVSEHEKYYYPQMDAKLKEIDKSLSKLDKRLKDIKNISKEDIQNEISDIDINDLSNRFKRDGYDNTITSN